MKITGRYNNLQTLFVCRNELSKVQEELSQVSMHYDSRREDYKLLEDKLDSTKREYESHINQLIKR